jgi:rRNA maturation protein Nop10
MATDRAGFAAGCVHKNSLQIRTVRLRVDGYQVATGINRTAAVLKSVATMKHDTCPDCGARIGEKHAEGCDVERCPHCGGRALGCVRFDLNDPRRQAWDGRWLGEADCERLGFFVSGDRGFPDLSRLFAECRWNADQQR